MQGVRPGGVLGQENGTDCGPTATELWLSRANIAKKKGGGGGCQVIITAHSELSNLFVLGQLNASKVLQKSPQNKLFSKIIPNK